LIGWELLLLDLSLVDTALLLCTSSRELLVETRQKQLVRVIHVVEGHVMWVWTYPARVKTWNGPVLGVPVIIFILFFKCRKGIEMKFWMLDITYQHAWGGLENKSSAKMIMIRQFCWILHFLFLFHVFLDNQTKGYSFVVAGLSSVFMHLWYWNYWIW